MKKSWVWVVAGGIMQLPMIQEIKNRGYSVLVTDRDTTAPGYKFSDRAEQIDTYDVAGHLNLAKSLSNKPVAVLTVGADVGPTVSTLAEWFNLPAEKLSVAKKVRNKISMRKAIDLPHPVYLEIDYDLVTPNSNWKARCKSTGIDPYPCVLKPTEASGSKGISLVSSPWQWTDAMSKARQFSDHNRRLLIEERLFGKEYAIDFFVRDNRLIFANAAERIFKTRGQSIGIEVGHVNPWNPPAEVIALAQKVVQSLGITYGPFKMDVIHDPRYGWCIMECATRLSGGFDHFFTAPLATGKDITGFMLDMALGLSMDAKKLKPSKSLFVAAIAPLNLLPGKVAKWNIPHDLPGQEKVIILAKDEIYPINNNTNRPAFAFASSTDRLRAIIRASYIAKHIQPEYTE